MKLGRRAAIVHCFKIINFENMEIITWLKIGFVLLCLALTVLAGYTPFLFSEIGSGAKWTGMANSFAGGIFLAVGLLHMLPESHE
jgi:zinc transporter ZupT